MWDDWILLASPRQGRPQNPGLAGEIALLWPSLHRDGSRTRVSPAKPASNSLSCKGMAPESQSRRRDWVLLAFTM